MKLPSFIAKEVARALDCEDCKKRRQRIRRMPRATAEKINAAGAKINELAKRIAAK